MNILLRKILLNISIFSFLLTCFVSYLAGAQLLDCLLRASVASLIMLIISGFVLKIVFRGIAAHIAQYEKAQKEKKKDAKTDNALDGDNLGDEENIAESEEKIAEELMGSGSDK